MLAKKYPLGFWATMNAQNAAPTDPDDWAAMGMSLTLGHLYADGATDKAVFRAMLDRAYQNGVQIILSDNRAQAGILMAKGEEAYRRNIRAILADWGDHPAVWGVAIGDEPHKEQYPAFLCAIRMWRQEKPEWMPYANQLPFFPGTEWAVGEETWGAYLDKFLRETDLPYLSYDCYTQMNPYPDSWDIYFTNLKTYGDAAKRANKEFWTILLSVPHFKYRDPSLDDIRWQFHTALACGAKGISWFYLYQQELWISNYRNAPINQLGRKTEKYQYISDVQNIFRRTLDTTLYPLTLADVYFTGHTFGGFPLLTDNDMLASNNDSDMILSLWDDPNDKTYRYLLAVNNSCTESVNYTVKLKADEIDELLTEGHWRSMNGLLWDDGQVERTETVTSLPHWYAPGQAVLYRFKPRAKQ